MRKEILSKKAKHILKEIKKTRILSDFYLAGGTALALQLGHRKSIDLDWFSPRPFLVSRLKKELKNIGKLRIDEEKEDTLSCVLSGVRLSFFEYPYKVLFPFIKYENGAIKLADLRDIACMKIDAISSRGSKKDFIDIYFILKNFTVKEALDFFEKKYRGVEYNRLHILKSLAYFKEAESQPMPTMLKKIKWLEIKKEIKKKIKEYLKENQS